MLSFNARGKEVILLNLPYNIEEDAVKQLVSKQVTLKTINKVYFILFETEKDAMEAVKELNGKLFRGRTLKAKLEGSKEPKPKIGFSVYHIRKDFFKQ